jgi:4-alpha-glucanotransferase
MLVPLPTDLPEGYHTLRVRAEGERFRSAVIAAPVKAFRHPRGGRGREWGIFCPAYALRSARNGVMGDLTDLRRLASWGVSLGGRVLGTLPLLATHTGERGGPFDPSPYSPVSRLAWNETYVDPVRAPGFEGCAAARRVLASAEYRGDAARLGRGGLVDYRRAAGLKRRVLEPLAEYFFSHAGEATRAFREFLVQNPLMREYAEFQATTEARGEAWSTWPSRMREGTLRRGDFDGRAARYHLFAQFAAWLEMLALGAELKASGAMLYLDLPVGVSPHGFDTWRHRGLFAACATGAPPDPYFTGGQNWGFPPMHPDACREDGYGYLRACLRFHMLHAEYLRLDHVMAFRRLFWIPSGLSAADGVYVRYRDEELYAVLCLESHRNRCRLVGENLGTVPAEVNAALTRHDLCGLYVGQYEMQPTRPALRPVPRNCVVSVNTHDMPPIARMWSAGDVDDRIGLGMLEKKRRGAERRTRERMKRALIAFLRAERLLGKGRPDLASVRDALLRFLARSPADFVLVNLEDLWLETTWQNIPGTMREHPNWRRRLRLTLEEIEGDGEIGRVLRMVDRARKVTRPGSG